MMAEAAAAMVVRRYMFPSEETALVIAAHSSKAHSREYFWLAAVAGKSQNHSAIGV
jgi:hypothetical protein